MTRVLPKAVATWPAGRAARPLRLVARPAATAASVALLPLVVPLAPEVSTPLMLGSAHTSPGMLTPSRVDRLTAMLASSGSVHWARAKSPAGSVSRWVTKRLLPSWLAR